MTSTLTPSLEDYLETIYRILQREPEARASEISDKMGVNRTSVTGAMRALRDRELVNYAPYGTITLTPEGKRLAGGVVRRHELLKEFMTSVLLAPEAEAEEAACQMEHFVTPGILERFVDFMEFMDACPRIGVDWKDTFERYRKTRTPCLQCDACIARMRAELARRKELHTVTEDMHLTLATLQPGQHAAIVDIGGEDEIHKRLIDMGVTPGTPVEVERVAPLGDPIDVRIRGYHLTLRKREAERIMVELR
jgi:DtxR family transcriptional regulator, Mn-dependent transcriptional regulator